MGIIFTRHCMILAIVSAIAATPTSLRVTLPSSYKGPAVGRVRLFLSTSCEPNAAPPSAQCSDDQDTSQVFGVDTPPGGLLPGQSVVIDEKTLGYPRWSLGDVPSSKYCIQAELFKHTTYHLGSGRNLTLPTSCVSPGGGDGEYSSPPGTLFSPIQPLELGPSSSGLLADLKLTTEVPPATSPGCSGKGADTEYIKTVHVTSKLLSAFWGTPIKLEACVLLPWGFHDHPTAKWARPGFKSMIR